MRRWIAILLVVVWSVRCVVFGAVETTEERKNDILKPDFLILPAPIKQWDNAIPLGNGLMGGLLWGEGRTIYLSLDRGDLWDERGNEDVYSEDRTFKTLMETYKARDRERWLQLFDATYHNSKWTKLPGGRLVITLPEGRSVSRFHLNFEKALGRAELDDGCSVSVFFDANEQLALIRMPAGSSLKVVRPESVNQLGYADPHFVERDSETGYRQTTNEELEYAVLSQWKSVDDELVAGVTVAVNEEGNKPLDAARRVLQKGLTKGWEASLEAHTAWWKKTFKTSTVSLPNDRLQNHYNLVKYLYCAGSRSFASPMPLQGVWTADAGTLPPWKGDYHNDLNTQMTYVAWQAAGLVDAGMAYLNYYWDRLPVFRRFAQKFFGLKEGAMVPGVMTHAGQAMGGWPQYAFSITAGLWNGHAFYQHWKVTGDDQFLEKKAYPWTAEVMRGVLALTEESDSKLYLPLSSSPEWNDHRWDAYLKPNSNYDQALLLWCAQALSEMAEALGKTNEAAEWKAVHSKLEPLKVDPSTHALLVAEGIPFRHSHRHFSHTLAIHPLAILHVDQSEDARKTVESSVRQIIDQGPAQWTGYSYSWAAGLAARAGFAEDALRLLVDYERGFLTRNGFHVNGDQTKSGLSDLVYRPFTLEGNFLFMDAVQEMMMQSYGGRVRIFPTIPDAWQDVSFERLRAEGGFIVSASRQNGITQQVSVKATGGGRLTLRNPFGDQDVKWSMTVQEAGNDLVIDLKADEIVTGEADLESN